MTNFTPFSALAGGVLIGASVTLLLLFNGRMAGVSGIMNGVVQSPRNEMLWRALFLCGLMIGAVLFHRWFPDFYTPRSGYPLPLLIGGGFLVGFGTRMGNGCTSGHGICGLANGSRRSIAATLIFMFSGMITVYFVKH
ncbi:MAG: YeeE/YedE family protein [Gammaproteobacteria bacterium]